MRCSTAKPRTTANQAYDLDRQGLQFYREKKYDLMNQTFGAWLGDQAIALCEWNNAPPSLYIRTNTLKAPNKPRDLAVEPDLLGVTHGGEGNERPEAEPALVSDRRLVQRVERPMERGA